MQAEVEDYSVGRVLVEPVPFEALSPGFYLRFVDSDRRMYCILVELDEAGQTNVRVFDTINPSEFFLHDDASMRDELIQLHAKDANNIVFMKAGLAGSIERRMLQLYIVGGSQILKENSKDCMVSVRSTSGQSHASRHFRGLFVPSGAAAAAEPSLRRYVVGMPPSSF